MRHHVFLLVALLAAGFSVVSAFNSAPGRLGCYEDNLFRVWQLWFNTHEKNNVEFCRNMCQDYKYAGLEAGAWCMCGNDIPGKQLPDSRCSDACPGDPGQSCGGGWALEVFAVEPKPVLIGKSLGCFQDTGDRVWKTGLIVLQNNGRERCVNSCRGFRYAGTEFGAWCICGNTIPPTPLPSSSCQTPCMGNGGQMCGGLWALDVYEISNVQDSVLSQVRVVGHVPQEYQSSGDLGTYKLYTQRMSWADALQQCEDDDAHLLIINSEREAQFVRDQYAHVPSERHMHAGFSDQLSKGSYKTIFGKSLGSTGYNLWSSLHPKVASPVKHCGSLDVHARLAQIDGNCEAQAVFICEKNLGSQEDGGQPYIDFRNKLGQAHSVRNFSS